MARTYGTNAQRGYNSTHWKLRANWKPLVEAGLVQCRAIDCQEERDGRTRWIIPGTPWHLGHTPDRSTWTGPEHARCNLVDGARRGNQNRDQFILAATPHGPTCKICGVKYHYTGKQCMICGRHYHPSRGVQYTCSRPCGLAYRRLGGYGAVKACDICGAPCKTRQQQTCGSKDCLDKIRAAKRTVRTCEHCGKKFEGGPRARHCSANCYYYTNREAVISQQLDRYYAKQGRPRPDPTVDHRTGRRKTGMTATQSRAW